jgi:hypothetical protein
VQPQSGSGCMRVRLGCVISKSCHWVWTEQRWQVLSLVAANPVTTVWTPPPLTCCAPGVVCCVRYVPAGRRCAGSQRPRSRSSITAVSSRLGQWRQAELGQPPWGCCAVPHIHVAAGTRTTPPHKQLLQLLGAKTTCAASAGAGMYFKVSSLVHGCHACRTLHWCLHG